MGQVGQVDPVVGRAVGSARDLQTHGSMWTAARRGGLAALGMALLLCLALAGCDVPGLGQATISGRVAGVGLAQRQAGQTVSVPLAATVRCNGTTVLAGADGTFTLTLRSATSYTCTVTGPQGYAEGTATLTSAASSVYTLTFDKTSSTACTSASQGNTIACPALALLPGKLFGTVVSGSAPLGGAQVTCKDLYDPQVALGGQAPVYATTTGANGAFTIQAVPVSTYGCIAKNKNGVTAYQSVPVDSEGGAATSFSLCAGACQRVTYHGGPVMHAQNVYLIYWWPSGYGLDPAGDAAFQSAVAQYFQSVGGTSFQRLLGQYYDYQGKIGTNVTLAGTYTDTSAFTHCPAASASCTQAAATTDDPLYDVDIQAEIARVLKSQGWQAGPENAFFVFLPTHAQACDTHGANSSCTYLQQNAAVCGYHSSYQNTAKVDVIYALIAAANTTPGACEYSVENAGTVAPNGSWVLDAEMVTVSHEQFEVATDPVAGGSSGGWYDDSVASQANGIDEIADICQDTFLAPNAAGANVVLQGHGYFVQAEWSNASQRCALQG